MRGIGLPRWLIALLFALALAGCGFRLAGTTSLPPELSRIHLVTGDFNRRQADALRDRLRGAGAEVIEEPGAQAVQLRVRLKILPNRRLVTGASNGRNIERVERHLDFSVMGADGEPLAPAKTLQQQRDITLDDDNLLSSDVERKKVVEELEAALFNQLIFQLKRL